MDFEAPPGPRSPPGQPGPAAQAAMRHGALARLDLRKRGYPALVDNDDDPTGDAVALAATRALLKVSSRLEAARVLNTAVNDLGGSLVPARLASETAISVDVSLGVGEPRVVLVLDRMGLASLRLVRHLPTLVEDALWVAARCDHHQRQSLRATTDALTGVASRGEIGLRLGLTTPGDVVCMVDLDGLKEVNDSRGHDAGDQVLRGLGRLLNEATRDVDFVGRYGGDEFIVILTGSPVAVAVERLRHLAASWATQTTHRTSVSIGLALIDDEGPTVALKAADRALYRAKRLGGDRVEIATLDDYLQAGQSIS